MQQRISCTIILHDRQHRGSFQTNQYIATDFENLLDEGLWKEVELSDTKKTIPDWEIWIYYKGLVDHSPALGIYCYSLSTCTMSWTIAMTFDRSFLGMHLQSGVKVNMNQSDPSYGTARVDFPQARLSHTLCHWCPLPGYSYLWPSFLFFLSEYSYEMAWYVRRCQNMEHSREFTGRGKFGLPIVSCNLLLATSNRRSIGILMGKWPSVRLQLLLMIGSIFGNQAPWSFLIIRTCFVNQGYFWFSELLSVTRGFSPPPVNQDCS